MLWTFLLYQFTFIRWSRSVFKRKLSTKCYLKKVSWSYLQFWSLKMEQTMTLVPTIYILKSEMAVGPLATRYQSEQQSSKIIQVPECFELVEQMLPDERMKSGLRTEDMEPRELRRHPSSRRPRCCSRPWSARRRSRCPASPPPEPWHPEERTQSWTPGPEKIPISSIPKIYTINCS